MFDLKTASPAGGARDPALGRLPLARPSTEPHDLSSG